MSAEVALSVRSLTVRFGGLVALDAVDLDVPRGAVVGLIGPNGAGKTTCIDAISGFVAAVDGASIHLGDRRLDGLPPQRRAHAGLARTFQSVELFDGLTVREHLVVATGRASWRTAVAELWWPRRHGSEQVDEVLDRLDLAPLADRRVDDLAHSVRRRVELAAALVRSPSVVLLDEPAAGLDGPSTRELVTFVRSLPERGVSVLLIDHDMDLVLGTCDTLHVLDGGRCIASGVPDEVRRDPEVVRAYLGSGAS
jgi:branched-chain amino acid transport system ATP-binding protein